MKPKQSETKRQLAEQANALFREFRNAYAREWQRQERNERLYRGEHWYDVPVTDPNEPRPVTPILQSTIENITADLMEQVPEALRYGLMSCPRCAAAAPKKPPRRYDPLASSVPQPSGFCGI